MTVYFDANNIYDAGTKAMQSSKFKHGTQLFEMNHLLTTAHIRRGFITGNYKPDPGNKFPINERGHPRYITSNTMVDKTVNHLLCDEVLTPSISKYLIYDNGASQKGKGVAFHRRRFEARLHQYFMQNGTNEGYILLVDFSGYYMPTSRMTSAWRCSRRSWSAKSKIRRRWPSLRCCCRSSSRPSSRTSLASLTRRSRR